MWVVAKDNELVNLDHCVYVFIKFSDDCYKVTAYMAGDENNHTLSAHDSFAAAQAALRELIKRIPVAQPGSEWTAAQLAVEWAKQDMRTFTDEELADAT
jgi:hypothetical protein